MIYAFITLAFVAILPFILEAGRKVPDPNNAPGTVAKLSQGRTHYRWIGPARGPVVVAIHGLTTPSPGFEKIATDLGALGYRTLVYDLYGRGFSDAVGGCQNREFFVRQLHDLLDELGLQENVTLMGYSMGGSIATSFAAEHPERMRRLILLASAGLVMKTSMFSSFCVNFPILGDWLHGFWAPLRTRLANKTEKHAHTEIIGIYGVQQAETFRRGFFPAVLSSRRGMLSEQLEEEHRTISRGEIPVIAIWGKKDHVIPIRALGALTQWNRLTRQDVVDGAGHGLPYTHGSKVSAIIRDVLRET
jgi:pimeloyl-ACP methyl ester carboxylesterase